MLFFLFCERENKEREIKTTAVFSHAAIESILRSHMMVCPGGAECGKVSKYVSPFLFFLS